MEKVFEMSEADLSSLEDFPLKWRWTDERWNKLPLENLRQINPLSESKAEELFKTHGKLFSFDKLNLDFVETEESIRTETTDFSTVKEWLKDKIGYNSEDVLISWHADLALKTTSKIFCDYWDDFCYPASDDVSVSAVNLKWILLYHHEEYFFFGKLKNDAFNFLNGTRTKET